MIAFSFDRRLHDKFYITKLHPTALSNPRDAPQCGSSCYILDILKAAARRHAALLGLQLYARRALLDAPPAIVSAMLSPYRDSWLDWTAGTR
jgi:hypothetical protein